MKKFIIFLIMCLCLTSCSVPVGDGDTSKANDSQSIGFSEESSPLDEQAQYNVYVRDKMCEMDGVYYFVMNTSIYYYDQASGQSGVLCGKVECEHKTHTCNGFVGPENFIAAYDGKIYSVASSLAGTKLYRVNPDGTNREEVRELNSLDGSNSRVYIHRGYVYTGITTGEVEDGQTSETFRLYQYELETNNDPILIMEETHQDIMIPHYHFMDDKIYMLLPYWNDEQTEATIYRIDILDNKNERLWTGEVGDGTTNFLVDEETLHIASKLQDGGQEVRILEYDIAKNTMEYGPKLKFAKGAYHITSEYIVFAGNIFNSYMIMDHNGRIFDEGSFFEIEDPSVSTVACEYIGEDDNAVFFQWSKKYRKNNKFCSDMYIVKWTPDSIDVLVEYNYVAE